MLYTGKGDDGTTKTLDSDKRISKSSSIAEVLGSLDELNSFLGLVKVKSDDSFVIGDNKIKDIIEDIQQNLFIIQAETAGFNMTLEESKLRDCEKHIEEIEKKLPPITTFFISGGTEIASLFDIARTLARKAERRVIAGGKVGIWSLAYLNRLSSILYALARLSNHLMGITEDAPSYK